MHFGYDYALSEIQLQWKCTFPKMSLNFPLFSYKPEYLGNIKTILQKMVAEKQCHFK